MGTMFSKRFACRHERMLVVEARRPCQDAVLHVSESALSTGRMTNAARRHERTPVDEALGRPCQDAVLDVVNSFHKAPVFAVAPQAGPGPELEDEFGDAEDAEMGDAASEAANEAPAPSGEIRADAGRQGG